MSIAARDGPKNTRVTPKHPANPLQAGIITYLKSNHPQTLLEQKHIPKRYTRYGSLLLLGPTFLSHPPPWAKFFSSLSEIERKELFLVILKAFKDSVLTHVAINAPIAPVTNENQCLRENTTRSPVGLQPVFGDFGPSHIQSDQDGLTRADFDVAYWTSMVQHNDISQVWAPRWTMFSRGNISEKARILQNGFSKPLFPGLTQMDLGEPVECIDVIDFYVGIGYFAFCYLARGVSRVWGWDVNGWSVEGLRRGCVNNRWGVRVIRIDEDGHAFPSESIDELMEEMQRLKDTPEEIRCIVFWGDNRWAEKVFGEIQRSLHVKSDEARLNVRHCNLGLLPSSAKCWAGAARLLNAEKEGWLHIHENVANADIVEREQEILQQVDMIAKQSGERPRTAMCCHVEQVKSYAPGVVHCVYDVKLYPTE